MAQRFRVGRAKARLNVALREEFRSGAEFHLVAVCAGDKGSGDDERASMSSAITPASMAARRCAALMTPAA